MTRTELDAAGIDDPALRSAYARCRELNARHGRTYFLATRLLAPAQRPAIHALYGFARWADDVVDHPTSIDHHDDGEDSGGSVTRRATDPAARLAALGDEFLAALDADRAPGPHAHPVVVAALDTTTRYRIDPALFADFLRSMRMDLTVTGYPDRAALEEYVRGSAQAIGLQVLHVLRTVVAPEQAAPHAAALGTAFQMTNFVRDIAEDLDRGRVYLPADELAAFGVDRALLEDCRVHGRTHPRVRAALADQHARIRETYRFAGAGVAMLHPVSRPCVSTALRLYSEILDRIEQCGFAVFDGTRAVVGSRRRATVAGAALTRAWWARRGARRHQVRVPAP